MGNNKETQGNDEFKILSIDGGGIRGIYPAYVLHLIEQRLEISLLDQFQLLAGTSTGSIIAAGIACGIPVESIVRLYKDCGPEIFKAKLSAGGIFGIGQAFHSIYDSTHLYELLKAEFGDQTLGDISIPLILPATDIGHGSVHVFKSRYSNEFTRDADVLVCDAVLASCAAPTYFDPVKPGNYLLADGGLWANNPALAAVIDAQHRLKAEQSDIQVLSLGTGQSRNAYGTNPKRLWGLINGWRGKEFIAFILSLQAQSTHNYLRLLLEPEQVLRLDFISDNPLPLDDPACVEDLISRADQTFTHRSSDLIRFFK